MRLALLWALGLLGAGSPLPSWPLPNIGGTEEQQAESEKALREPLEPQVLQDDLPISLKKVLQTSLPEPLRIKLELDGDSHILELLQNRELVSGLNFSNCSRRALEKALLDGMGSCLFERLPSRPPMAAFCGNMFVEPGEQCDCGFPDDCVDPCCDSSTCQLRPFAQCASDGPCCQNCQVCDSNRHCYCEEGWAPPDCTTQLKAISSLTTGLLLSLLVLLVLVMLGASYWYRARLHQRLCQLKGPTCQYRAAQSGLPERPGPPQRALLARGTKSQGPAKPPPPRKPLPADPQGQCPSGDLPGPGAGIPPLVVPSRPAPPPPTVSSLYL
uniref:ADAM metallopeptidase domain 15 n=1 Tax=Nomascus leucogenys TaxID=61853 RepID=A0A2I3H7L7_NOMLE